jgi:hypothetical protein
VETSPNRSALPTAYANIVSAPITVSPAAAAQVIHAASDAVSRMLAVEPITTPEQPAQLRIRRIRLAGCPTRRPCVWALIRGDSHPPSGH